MKHKYFEKPDSISSTARETACYVTFCNIKQKKKKEWLSENEASHQSITVVSHENLK